MAPRPILTLALGTPAERGCMNKTQNSGHSVFVYAPCVGGIIGCRVFKKARAVTFDGSQEDKGGSSEDFGVFESTSRQQDPRL